jgi:hypothetical protein
VVRLLPIYAGNSKGRVGHLPQRGARAPPASGR